MTDYYHKPTTLAAWHACNGDSTLRLAFPLSPSSRVIDIGAFVGDWALAITQRYGCVVECYEPLGWACDVIDRRKGESRISVRCQAVTGDGRSVSLSDHGDQSVVADGGGVLSLAINDILSVPADLVKLNVEGAEYEILGAADLRRVRWWLIQFHGPDSAKRDAAVKWLSETHRLMWTFPGVWQAWERIQ